MRRRACVLVCALLGGPAGACITEPIVSGDDDGSDDSSGANAADSTGASPGSVCGDGIVVVGEQCDGDNLGGKTCETFGTTPGELGLRCLDDCTLDLTGCVGCGNGILDPGEVCDGAELGGATCDAIEGPFTGGTLACTEDCQLDTTECEVDCGNGILDEGEDCDPDGFFRCEDLFGPEFTGMAWCAACHLEFIDCSACGDGIAGGDEACDGSPVGPNGFPLTCTGLLGFPSGGEVTCNANCTANISNCSLCGNGILDFGELCDGPDLGGVDCSNFGFPLGERGCHPDCTYDPSGCTSCGDDVLDPGEQCDGTNLAGEDCVSQGFIDGTLGCAPDCSFDVSGCGSCGDGVAVPGELCDGMDLGTSTCADVIPGAQAGTPTCQPDCTLDGAGCILITPGAVVVTEIFKASLLAPLSQTGEWFELYNADPALTWNLEGCDIKGSAPIETFTIDTPVVIAPGEYVAFGNGTPLELAFTPAYTFALPFSLNNFGDEIELECGGIVVDHVAFDDMLPWPEVPNGVAIQLDPTLLDAVSNDAPESWCAATNEYGLMHLGTPGAANDPC